MTMTGTMPSMMTMKRWACWRCLWVSDRVFDSALVPVQDVVWRGCLLGLGQWDIRLMTGHNVLLQAMPLHDAEP